MRTLGFRSNVLLVLAMAAGIVASLSRPWYAPSPRVATGGGDENLDGPLKELGNSLLRAATRHTGTSAWHALGPWGATLAATALGVAALVALCVPAATQPLVRELLRYGAFAVPAMVVWKLLVRPGAQPTELRYGALIALACSIVELAAALSVAGAPLRRRTVRVPFEAPPPPPAFETLHSVPPPGR